MQVLNHFDTSFEHLSKNFIASCKAKGLADKTISSYSGILKHLSSYLYGSTKMENLKAEDIERMISQMRDKGLSPNTIQCYIRTLRVFLSWCRERGYSDLQIKNYKGVETIKDTYTDEELLILLKKPDLKTCNFQEYRNWVIINLLVNCGCRAGTIRAIQIRDIDLEHNMIFFRHTKTRKIQAIPLCNEMKSILIEYLEIRNGDEDDPLFCEDTGNALTENALKKAIYNYNRKRGVQKTSIHLFRHTFARKFLIDCKGDAFTLQHILGHSTLEMTKHYCSIYNADITKDYERFSPLAQLTAKKKAKISTKKLR